MASTTYLRTMACLERFVPQKFLPLWLHPAGPKTVHFWAPVFKSSLVIAGIGDLQRPADQLSIPQYSTLSTTGLIWSRYSLVIVPKNYIMFCVNMFIAITSLYSLSRAVRYEMENKNETIKE